VAISPLLVEAYHLLRGAGILTQAQEEDISEQIGLTYRIKLVRLDGPPPVVNPAPQNNLPHPVALQFEIDMLRKENTALKKEVNRYALNEYLHGYNQYYNDTVPYPEVGPGNEEE